MIEITIISLVSIILIFVAFIVGLHYGSKVKNNEPINLPVKAIKEHIEDSKASKRQEQERLVEETLLHNIDVYDGTSFGQQDIPRGDDY